MKRSLFLLLSCSLLLTLSLTGCKKGGSAKADTSIIPVDANIVGSVNMAAFLKMPAAKKMMKEMKAEEMFKKETGLALSSLKGATFFAKMDSMAKQPDFAALISGVDIMKSNMGEKLKKSKKESYNKVDVYGKNHEAFAVISGSTLFGTKAGVKLAIDVKTGKGKGGVHAEVKSALAKVSGSAASVAFAPTAEMMAMVQKQAGPAAMVPGAMDVLKSAKASAIGVVLSGDTVKVKVVVKADSKAVKALAAGANTMLKAQAKMIEGAIAQAGPMKDAAEKAYKSLSISASGDFLVVSVAIDASVLVKNQKMLMGMMR